MKTQNSFVRDFVFVVPTDHIHPKEPWVGRFALIRRIRRCLCHVRLLFCKFCLSWLWMIMIS